MCIPAYCAPLAVVSVNHSTKRSALPPWLRCELSLVIKLVLRKPRWPIVVEGDRAFPVEQSLAPTVVESNVPERTRRRGEYGARVFGRKITVSFFVPSPLKHREQTKPEFLGGFIVFSSPGGGKRGIGAASFFFLFFVFFFSFS